MQRCEHKSRKILSYFILRSLTRQVSVIYRRHNDTWLSVNQKTKLFFFWFYSCTFICVKKWRTIYYLRFTNSPQYFLWLKLTISLKCKQILTFFFLDRHIFFSIFLFFAEVSYANLTYKSFFLVREQGRDWDGKIREVFCKIENN